MQFRNPFRHPSRPLPSRPAMLPAEDSPVLTNGHHPQEPSDPSPERILSFPSALMDDSDFSPGRFCGFRSDAFEMAGRLFHNAHPTLDDFRPRTKLLEADPSWKQVVACVVPWHAPTQQVWTFRRGETEGRLTGKLSCLVGGHVNVHDAWPDGKVTGPVDLMDVIWRAALRELDEEIDDWKGNWRNGHSDCRLVLAGCVNDEDDIGVHHFGFVYRLDLAKLDIPLAFAKDAGESAGWVPVSELADAEPEDVESWSRFTASYLREHLPVRTTS